MTLPDLPARRKPPSRWWLYGPYGALILAAIVWSGAWIVIRGQVARRLDAAATATGGPTIAWDRRRIGGYPFRIEVILDGVRTSEPSGWGLSAPQVRAESYAYDLKHWVAYAPHGVVLNRPGAGPVAIRGAILRASVAVEAPGQTRVSVEGQSLIFTPSPGSRPFPVTAIDHFDGHTRPGLGPDQTEFLIQMKDATLAPGGPIARLAAGTPVSSAWLGTLSKSSALTGRDWPDAGRAWRAAGGAIAMTEGDLTAGPAKLEAKGGHLAIEPDGRLAGTITFAPNGLTAALSALGHATAPAPTPPAGGIDLSFQAGKASLGAVPLGPAPRVY